jgi:L-asparagine oxygenase
VHSNKPLEWTGHHSIPVSQSLTPCLPFRGSVGRTRSMIRLSQSICRGMLQEERLFLINSIKNDGFAFLPSWRTESTTHEIAESIGTIIEISLVANGFRFGKIQTLQPREGQPNSHSLYSDIYGFGRFPLHTDLAYFYHPPHYLLLRCLQGTNEVKTKLVKVAILKKLVDESTMRRARVRPRNLPEKIPICILPMILPGICCVGMRWDSAFLIPVNESAVQISDAIASLDSGSNHGVDFTLENYGDTLIIDNWRMFHGRSSVPSGSATRTLERIYLSGLHQ